MIIEELKHNLSLDYEWEKMKSEYLKQILFLLKISDELNSDSNSENKSKNSTNDLKNLILLNLSDLQDVYNS
jgi:hypothetical protein